MEWLKRLNEAVDYIERNLDGEIDLDRAARIACCSPYHFQRMFSYIADVPLSEYIRRRKMTLAAFELQNSDGKVLDIALRYGYDSPTAFNRAFQRVHGVAPSAAKREGVALKAYAPIQFQLSVKGDVEMNYKIVNKPEFRIVGKKKHYVGGIEESMAQIPSFWQEVFTEGLLPKICPLMDREPFGVLGAAVSDNGQDFDYYIAVATDGEKPDGLEEYRVPACSWAVFESIGPLPGAIQTLQKRIVTEWLPSSGYDYADAPDIEIYYDGDQQSADYRCEVWLPVVKKK